MLLIYSLSGFLITDPQPVTLHAINCFPIHLATLESGGVTLFNNNNYEKIFKLFNSNIATAGDIWL